VQFTTQQLLGMLFFSSVTGVDKIQNVSRPFVFPQKGALTFDDAKVALPYTEISKVLPFTKHI